MKHCLILAGFLAAFPALAQSRRAELFDTSGMPRRPTTFIEQQIFEMIATHKPGDSADAVRVQRELGRYYADRGDEERATACFLAAADAQRAVEDKTGGETAAALEVRRPQPPEEPIDDPRAAVPAPPSKLTGSYFGYDERTLHTWDFRSDSTFLHTWIASGAGTSVRNSERGAYRLTGNVVELKTISAAGGFVTPGVGGRSAAVGGGAEANQEVRRLKFEVSDSGVVLDGVKLKPKSS
jgi:hypothetical protein